MKPEDMTISDLVLALVESRADKENGPIDYANELDRRFAVLRTDFSDKP